jgi:AAA+ ATPase superfamily predicted ATPase
MEYNTGIAADSFFASFQSALEYVFELAKTKRIVLVIDEYPYVARASKSLASTLQLLIDKNKDNSRLFLILCGSSMSYMEDHVLAYKAPLYGRRTAQLKINPFDFFEEPGNLLKQEVREPAIYNAVITAIATGCSKMNEISNKIDENTRVCATYIKNLITLGIVKKNRPTAKNRAVRRFTLLRIICSAFGIALCRKTPR